MLLRRKRRNTKESFFSGQPLSGILLRNLTLQYNIPISIWTAEACFFSPSKKRVIISNRVFLEKPDCDIAELVRELTRLLEAEVIIIPSLKSDMTGHADGMVRFFGRAHGDWQLCSIKKRSGTTDQTRYPYAWHRCHRFSISDRQRHQRSWKLSKLP